MRILLIDDSPTQRMMVREWLPEHDFVEASTATDGIRKFNSRGPFDVVLCDVYLPDVAVVDGKPTAAEQYFRQRTRNVITMSASNHRPAVEKTEAKIRAAVADMADTVDLQPA